MIGWTARGAVVLASLACGQVPGPAYADDGDGYGAGPVIGITGDGTLSLGWEASMTFGGFPIAKASAGGSYQVGPAAEEPYTFHYAVIEPWLFVGGTVGVAVADGANAVRGTFGIWEGFPIPLQDDQPVADAIGISEPAWMLTFAFGMRWFGSTSQLYLTPKLWRFTSIGFNS